MLPIHILSTNKVIIDYTHAQGCGCLQHHNCDVTYHWLVPQQSFPQYFLFISYGVHHHPPPPPSKPPQEILEGLMEAISDQAIRKEPSVYLTDTCKVL